MTVPAMPQHAARLLAVGSGRGGSGKTTVSLALAHALASAHGRTVTLVDLDPQGSCSLYAGSRPVVDPLAAEPVDLHGVRLYRGGEGMAAALPHEIQSHLRRAGDGADVVVVDLPPALTDQSHQAVLTYPVTLLVLTVELEPGSLQPAAKLVRMAQNAGVLYEVLPNKMNARTVSAGALLTLQGAYGSHVSEIVVKDDAKAPESISKRQPVTAFRPSAPSSKALFGFAESLVLRGLA